MPEHDPLIRNYRHLANFPRAQEALLALKKVASLVKPIMRARGWRVPELAEFFPDQQNLLGLNVNRGQKILLRLRHAGDKTQFLPKEQVTDTMLHELAHIVHGPHDASFHALWNQLRDEAEGLIMKGYTGEGFLSDGHRLGGSAGGRLPMHEARRLARAEAEKRRVQNMRARGSGRKLGGAPPRRDRDIRSTIADAVERRNTTLRGCGNEGREDGEIRRIEQAATKNGFRTQAEEDRANEEAIAQALWELVQEEEKAKMGEGYVAPSQENPAGSSSGGSGGGEGESAAPELRPDASAETRVDTTGTIRGWTCGVCTLYNPSTFLCCDACGSERGEDSLRRAGTSEEDKRRKIDDRASSSTSGPPPPPPPPSLSKAAASTPTPAVDLTGSSPPRRPAKRARSRAAEPAPQGKSGGPSQATAASQPAPAPQTQQKNFWMCSYCGQFMERQWWTCSACGRMKDESR